MAAVMNEASTGRFDSKATKSALNAWGNWYVMRTSHEFGWASHDVCLSYYGLFVAGHKVLFDTPSHVRFVDVAVGRLPDFLRNTLALKYWWLRDLTTGQEITDRQKAEALGLESPNSFREVLNTARLLAQHAMEELDLRRESANLCEAPE